MGSGVLKEYAAYGMLVTSSTSQNAPTLTPMAATSIVLLSEYNLNRLSFIHQPLTIDD